MSCYKKNEKMKPTIRLFSGKMRMLSKLSLESFTYDFTENFSSPVRKQKKSLINT